MKYYAVFDTNVLVASLLTKHPDSPTALVVDAISEEKLIPLYNEEILEEYDDVLHRAKFPFSNDAIQNIIADDPAIWPRYFPQSYRGGPAGHGRFGVL